jgi:2-polyprenyl-3-methyl-5-hydroxy-6-metoxy-1,4-benzoquinol methylase
MPSPWLTLPLAEYEGHMSAPNVGQAALLAGVLANALRRLRPVSVAVIGCAGGSGFDRIDPRQVGRVVGVDINPDYLAIARTRYSARFKELELHCADIAAPHFSVEPVEFIYAALVLEYVDASPALRNLAAACAHGGHLITLSQRPSKSMGSVTSTDFTRVQTLSAVLEFVDPRDLEAMAHGAGFELRGAATVSSVAGKDFALHTFQRSSANKSLLDR